MMLPRVLDYRWRAIFFLLPNNDQMVRSLGRFHDGEPHCVLQTFFSFLYCVPPVTSFIGIESNVF